MAERAVHFTAGELELEGLLSHDGASRGVVVCHPHPLHGGELHNPVVVTAAEAYAEAGYSVLRFNFRGTGASEGSFGGGIDEVEDVRGAVAFLRARGVEEVCLVGYSFGAYVIARLPGDGPRATGLPAGHRVLIAPPVAVMDFSGVGAIAGLIRVVTGSRDTYAPPAAVAEALPAWCGGAGAGSEATLEVIQGADHFFGGYLGELRAALAPPVPPR